MTVNNICKFVPAAENAPTTVDTVNFVWETSSVAETPSIRSVYGLHLVMRGKGMFLCDGKQWEIEKGDLFFTRPDSLYAIKSTDGLEYAYVSFLGLGAPVLMRRIDPLGKTAVFKHNDALIDFWNGAIRAAHPNNTDLLSKSVLEYSAALLIERAPQAYGTDEIKNIEQYVRKHFTDSDLSLKSLSVRFGYNEKYLSKLFYRFTGNHFGDYLTNLRINAACGMIQEGNTVVKQIAFACGFSDALYFSKVFKAKMHCSPSAFITERNGANT